jgi:hypothetical protein
MLPKMIRKFCAISADGKKLLENAIIGLDLSARAHDRILKVARTIADLDVAENVEPRHPSEAIRYRTRDRSYWAWDPSIHNIAPFRRRCSIDSLSAYVLPIVRAKRL